MFVSHIEYWVPNPEKTKNFLTQLLDISFQAYGSNYWLYTPTQPYASCIGLMTGMKPYSPPAVIAYIQVESIEKYIIKIENLGGSLIQTITDIPEYGRYLQFADQDQVVFGLFVGTK